ncbi:MAG: hypothetical protein HC933_00525 [Pleurocapsa sp. SU_196_0]|nr:hypothetical protein [Pleurocapsa sp. SU_196_0]
MLVRFGGMRQLVKDLGGRLQDRRKQLEYLSSVGLIGGLTRLEGEDSELVISFPADLRDLPAYREHLRLCLPVSDKARAARERFYSPPQSPNPVVCRTKTGGEYPPTRLQTLRRVARTALALQHRPDTLAALVTRTRHSLETIQSHLSDLVTIGFATQTAGVYTLNGDYRLEVRREQDFHDPFVERCKRDLESSAEHWRNVAADPDQPMWKRASARRRRDLAILRFERIDAGERVSEVMRRAA